MSRTIYAFSDEEAQLAQKMLADLVRALRFVPGGGKIEEDFWSHIYHTVRNAPRGKWSNLPMRDFCHSGLGVEMKLLQRNSPIVDQGRRLMHPSATRTIQYDPSKGDEASKVEVLNQFGARITSFRERVAEACATTSPEIRWGIFLWSPRLDEFLYFEELIEEPNPDNYYAKFVDGTHRGKPTKNLHIFERSTDIKRFSITLPKNGAKVQMYFDVPQVGKGAYSFQVPDDNRTPIWLLPETLDALRKYSNTEYDFDSIIFEALKYLRNR